MRLNLGRLPPTSDGQGGWEFPVQAGVMLRAADQDGLIRTVYEFRQRQGIPIGDIERDINEYYCGKWPTFCEGEPGDKNPLLAVPSHQESLKSRIARWVSAAHRMMPRGGFILATSAEASERAKTCLGCPYNKSWRNGCKGCSASTAQMLLQIRQLRKTPHDGNLLGCMVGGWCNQTAVHMPLECSPVTDLQRTMMPEKCWRKALT